MEFGLELNVLYGRSNVGLVQFRLGTGYMDQVFAVRPVCEMYLAKGKDVFWAFMDEFWKAV